MPDPAAVDVDAGSPPVDVDAAPTSKDPTKPCCRGPSFMVPAAAALNPDAAAALNPVAATVVPAVRMWTWRHSPMRNNVFYNLPLLIKS